MNIPFYENKLPEQFENVLVIFTKHTDTHIEALLLEYDGICGMMTYEDSTRRKKVYDWKKEVPLNKPTIARIEKIIDTNYVQLSTLNFIDKRKDPGELYKELMKPFNDNKVLINIIKKICRQFNIDINEFWSKIIYKIDSLRREDDINESLLETFINNLDTVKDLSQLLKIENNVDFLAELTKLINHKSYKFETKFSLITKLNINKTTDLLKLVESKNTWAHNIKYSTASSYLLESSSDSSNEDNHKELIEMIKTYCPDNIDFKLEYLAKQM